MSLEIAKIKQILEAIILATDKPMTVTQLQAMFAELERPTLGELRQALQELEQDYRDRGIILKEVASGYRFQVRQELSPWVAKLWEEKPPKYSRAYLETLALIAYRQPITRGEIEDIRGVAVSSHIMKTMLERNWIKVVGHRDVPGRPGLYATTKEFLDYFNLKNLEDLPTLEEVRDLDNATENLQAQLELEDIQTGAISQDKSEKAEEEEVVIEVEQQTYS